MEKVRNIKLMHTITGTTLTQVAMAHFLSIGRYDHFLKKMRSTLEYSRADCDPAKPSSPNDEQAAKTQYDFLETQIQGPRPDQAIRTLDRLLKRYWRTEFLKDKRAELITVKEQLNAKITPP